METKPFGLTFRKTFTVLLPLLILSGLTIIPYHQVIRFDFLNFDDGKYILENPFVQNGLSFQAVKWAFTSNYFSNWHPLTWLTYTVIYQNAGANPAPFHLLNAVLHLLNVLLLFFILNKTAGSSLKAFAAAAFFAIHPVHVQSVAWISELKDVLSTFWGLLALGCYAKWASGTGTKRHFRSSLVCYAFSLLSKQTLVTFPVILLLFDWWPLRRMTWASFAARFREKVPFFIVAVAAGILVFWAQSVSGAVQTFETYPIETRVMNAISSYFDYMVKLFYPAGLSIYYPYVRDIPGIKILSSLSLMAALTFLAFWQRRSKPYLFFGWFFFLITLLPMIGFIQIGSQAMADRYTYVPFTGLYVLVGFGACEFFNRTRALKVAGFLVLASALLLLLKQAYAEVGYWKDSITLFQRNVEVNPDNYLARYQLGSALYDKGRADEAKKHVEKALELLPSMVRAYNLLGVTLIEEKKFEEAKEIFWKGLEFKPDDREIYNNLGGLYMETRQYDVALNHFMQALKIDPEFHAAYPGLLNSAYKSCNFQAIAEYLPRIRSVQGAYPRLKSVLDWLGQFEGKPLSEADVSCREEAELNDLVDLVRRTRAVSETPKPARVFETPKVHQLPTQT